MLPTVVIGADDSAREAFETWNSDAHVLFCDTAEHAVFTLSDTMVGDQPVAEQEDDGRWRVTVVYDPLSHGPIATAQAGAQLPHSGWTVVAGANLRNDQATPYRVTGGRPEGSPSGTMVFEVMAKVAANFVVDVALASGDASLESLRRLLQERPTP